MSTRGRIARQSTEASWVIAIDEDMRNSIVLDALANRYADLTSLLPLYADLRRTRPYVVSTLDKH
jgi:hypothetical protein